MAGSHVRRKHKRKRKRKHKKKYEWIGTMRAQVALYVWTNLKL